MQHVDHVLSVSYILQNGHSRPADSAFSPPARSSALLQIVECDVQIMNMSGFVASVYKFTQEK